jgi:hypothetical protein
MSSRKMKPISLRAPFENRGFKLQMKAADGDGARPVVKSFPHAEGNIAGNMITGYGDTEMVTYLNPFSESANIQFSLDRASEVSFDIYDITGKAVRIINAGSFAAGENLYVITRENLRTGIYILRMNAGNNTLCKVENLHSRIVKIPPSIWGGTFLL